MLGAGAGRATARRVLALTRQNLPQVRTEAASENLCARGAYRLQRRQGRAQGDPDRHRLRGRDRAAAPREQLEAQGIGADVVSMPCDRPVRRAGRRPIATTSCPTSQPRDPAVSIEAGTTIGWERYTGLHGLRIGIDRFGASAPARGSAYEHFGFTAEAIAPHIVDMLQTKGNAMTTELRSTASAGSAAWSPAPSSSGPIAGSSWSRSTTSPTPSPTPCCSSATASTAPFPGEVTADGNDLVIDGKRIQVTAERDPGQAAARRQRRRHRARMHRLLHRPRRRRRSISTPAPSGC